MTIGKISLIEHEVTDALRGAQILALIPKERIAAHADGEGYWEEVFYVAWQREDQCGTHQANVNSEEQTMLVHGHYNIETPEQAVLDALQRADVSVLRVNELRGF